LLKVNLNWLIALAAFTQTMGMYTHTHTEQRPLRQSHDQYYYQFYSVIACQNFNKPLLLCDMQFSTKCCQITAIAIQCSGIWTNDYFLPFAIDFEALVVWYS
jgi:hypothetical protein